ncbi:hypothetical protein [Lysobacter fragariae]
MSRLLAFAALALASGCASGGGITPGSEFTMTVGAQVTLPDAATLRYTGIANDSRCPPDVQCIRAGDADVLFAFTPHGGAGIRITLNTERTLSAQVGGWQLQLVSLVPGGSPRATVRIDPH